MSQIITWGRARVGLSWKHAEPPAPTVYCFCIKQQQAQRYWGFYASNEGPQDPRGNFDMNVKASGLSRATPTYKHLGLLSLSRESEVVGR